MKKRKGCMITLWIIGGIFVVISWLALRDWKDQCSLILYRAGDTAVIAQTVSSVLCLTDLKGKYDNDTLVIHSYSKFMYFTLLKSRRAMIRGLSLEHPVKYVRYLDKVYPFEKLHIWRYPKDITLKPFRKVKDR